MNKIFATIFIFILQLTLHAQWVNKNPFPEGNYLRSVFFADDNSGWIAGSGGIIARTTDSGETWNQQASGTSYTLKSIYFIDNSTGWIVGANGKILFTSDGGSSWSDQISSTHSTLNSVYFIDQNTGWTAGEDGTILFTNNGGMNWSSLNSGTSLEIFDIKFVNSLVGYAVGGDGFMTELILKTTDGGNNWLALSSGTDGVLYSTAFVNETTGWAVGFERKIIKTTDGGSTWNLQNFGKRSLPPGKMSIIDGQGGLRSIYFKDSDNGWTVGGSNEYYRTIYQTTDGGETWINKYFGSEEYDLFSVAVTPSGKSWAVGGGGSIFYSANGDDWVQQFSGTSSYNSDDIYKLQFVNSNVGYAAGFRNDWVTGSGLVLKTTDGGKTWLTVYLDYESGEPYKSLFFIDKNNGWTANYSDYIRHTTDGGITWTTQAVGSPFSVNSLFFTDVLTGFASGEGIYKTTDGGGTWTSKYAGNINSIFFVDASIGWGIGTNTVKTTDGGETWIEQDGIGGNDIYFYSSLLGWASGSSGSIKSTTDGGNTWISQASGTSENLNSIHFTDEMNGWTSGNNGIILATGDGGVTWSSQSPGTAEDIRSIFFSHEGIGWAGGDTGTLLKYDGSLIPGITLTSPNGGEEWQAGNTQEIKWTKNFDGDVSISLFKGNQKVREITSRTNDSGNYNWTIPLEILNSDNYRIKVTSIEDSSIYALSDSTFSITGGVVITGVSSPAGMPLENSLEQNYPNPFNPSTMINYNIAEGGNVTLKVYDITGREVASIVNENKSAGRYSVTFNGSNLASGVYFYILRNGSFVQTKKFLLVK